MLFAENLHENVLLPYPYRHLVFSLPKRLRIYFKFDRRLFSKLYRAAWQTWSEYVEATFPGAKPGAVMALHTAGSLLNWHPHIHTIALDGGVLPDGSFAQLTQVDTALLEEFFAEKVFKFLLDSSVCIVRELAARSAEKSGSKNSSRTSSSRFMVSLSNPLIVHCLPDRRHNLGRDV